MIFSKSTIAITVLALACIAAVAVLLQNAAIDQSPTLQQMLSKQDRASITHYQQLFDIESEPVILAITSPTSALTSDRITGIEKALQSINSVSNTLSSASAKYNEKNTSTLFNLKNDTEIILLMTKPDLEHSITQQIPAAINLSNSIKQTVNTLLRSDESALITGLPQIRAASWEITSQDLKVMLPLLVLLTIVITLLLFNSYTALTLSLILASLTTAICLAGQLVINAEINLYILMMIPVIWAISTLDAFHLYSRTNLKLKRNTPGSAKNAAIELFTPCLLTTITTAACFLTLTATDTSPLITNIGIWGASGTIIAFVLTFTLGKYLLSLNSHCNTAALWPRKISFSLVKLAQKHNTAMLSLWIGLAILALLLLPKLQVTTPFPQIFTADTNIASEIKQLKKLTNSDLNPIDIIIEATNEHGKETQSHFSAALLLNNYLKTIEETRLILPIDLITSKDRQQIIDSWKIREDKQNNLLTQNDYQLNNWINKEQHAIRLQVYMSETSFDRKQEIITWLNHFDDTMLSHHKITLSGSGYFYNEIERQGLKSLITSSFLSLLIITVVMTWITRNKKQLLFSLIATIIPVILVMGIMAIFNTPWSVAMLPLPALLIGLMIDDTIHILWRNSKSTKQTQSFSNHFFQHNALTAGPALLATTLVLSFAASILMLSGIQTNFAIGFLVPAGLLLAYLCNLSLIPALNSWSHK